MSRGTIGAVRIHRYGGPAELRYEEVPLPEPAAGEVRVQLEAAGVNYIDVYNRTGFYPLAGLPAGLGKEGAGVVETVGPGVAEVREGDRVAFWDATGAYAEAVVIPAARAIPLPAGLDFRRGAALPLQGMTAHYLVRGIRPLAPGDRVLVHAAAGGVGLLAVQLAKLAGAEVFGTCSTEAKAARAREAGADQVILYGREDFAEAVLAATGGHGADLVLDGVGRATFEADFRAARVRGHVVLFGQASGEPGPIRPRKLMGSRTLTTASLFDYAGDRGEMLERAGEVFALAAEGKLRVTIDRELPLAEAAEAHRLLEGRKTVGKLLLLPSSGAGS